MQNKFSAMLLNGPDGHCELRAALLDTYNGQCPVAMWAIQSRPTQHLAVANSLSCKGLAHKHDDMDTDACLLAESAQICSSNTVDVGERALSDMSLEYLHPQDLGLAAHDVQEEWPQPKAHMFPFDGGLIDYCRFVGPGVLVGKGLKAPKDGHNVGNEFVYFLLVKV